MTRGLRRGILSTKFGRGQTSKAGLAPLSANKQTKMSSAKRSAWESDA